MQRGARVVFREMRAIHSRRGSKGLKGQRSHAAWRSFFQKKRSHAAWRSKCSVSLRRLRSPVLCFPVFGASSFLSCCIFGALALCFSIVRGRPFHFLKLYFSGWALWCFIFQYAALSFWRFGASPWVDLLARRVRSGAQSARRHLGACRFMIALKKRQKACKNNGFGHF